MTEKNVHMYYIKVTEGKNEKLKKESKMRISILIFIYTRPFAYLKVYKKFENTGSNSSREICDRNFHWRERKMNKANSTNLYPPAKGYLRETCKSQNINPIYLTLSSPTVSFRS